jgi:type II secretory pathway component HofQ
MATSSAWDRLPEIIISLITVKVTETSEDPLQDLRSLWLCNKATKRASLSRTVANCFNLASQIGFGVKMICTNTTKPWTGCKLGTTEEPSSSTRGPTYAQTDPVVRRSSYEQKETYKRPTCWPSSSTTSTA